MDNEQNNTTYINGVEHEFLNDDEYLSYLRNNKKISEYDFENLNV